MNRWPIFIRDLAAGRPRKALRDLVDAFLAGLIFLLPILITIVLLDWLSGVLAAGFGPDSLIGGGLAAFGEALVGERGPWGFLVGMAFLVVAVAAFGTFMQTRFRASIESGFDKLIDRIPLLRSVYRPIAQIVRILGPGDDNQLAGMKVIACRLSGSASGGAEMLALLANPQPVMMGGEPRYIIYLPTAPFPGNGGLCMVPVENVRLLEDVSFEDLVRVYVSFGTLAPPATIPPAPHTAVGAARALD